LYIKKLKYTLNEKTRTHWRYNNLLDIVVACRCRKG